MHVVQVNQVIGREVQNLNITRCNCQTGSQNHTYALSAFGVSEHRTKASQEWKYFIKQIEN